MCLYNLKKILSHLLIWAVFPLWEPDLFVTEVFFLLSLFSGLFAAIKYSFNLGFFKFFIYPRAVSTGRRKAHEGFLGTSLIAQSKILVNPLAESREGGAPFPTAKLVLWDIHLNRPHWPAWHNERASVVPTLLSG